MLKNLFNSADDRSAKPQDTEQQPIFNPDRATMTGNTAKQQLLAILQDAQYKLEGNNSPATEPLRQNLRCARFVFCSVTTYSNESSSPIY